MNPFELAFVFGMLTGGLLGGFSATIVTATRAKKKSDRLIVRAFEHGKAHGRKEERGER